MPNYKHPLYHTWQSMIGRCKYPSFYRYDRYGGRGISVCKEWKDINTFAEWMYKNDWKKGLQIDRINNDGDYTPLNCRIVDKCINAQNTNMYKPNKTGYKGVFKLEDHYREKPFWCKITVNKKVISLGYYKEAKEAAIVRNDYISEHDLHHKLNFIKEGE